MSGSFKSKSALKVVETQRYFYAWEEAPQVLLVV